MPFLDLEEGIAEIFAEQTGQEWFDGVQIIRRKGRGKFGTVEKSRVYMREWMRRRRRRIRLERALKYTGQIMREVEQQCATLSSLTGARVRFP